MPKWSIVVISIIALLISIYIIGFLLCLIFKNIFKIKIIKRSKTINFLTNQNNALLIDFKNEIIKKKININEENLKSINSINRQVDILEKNFDYSSLNNQFLSNYNYLCSLENDNTPKINLIKSAIDNNTNNLRKNIAVYNSNIIGYSYWISVKWFKWLLKRFKFKKFEKIN